MNPAPERSHLPGDQPSAYAEAVGRLLPEDGDQRGALLPLLHALQAEFGYIDDALVPHVAAALNLSRADVHGVVTFYHDFRRRPAGRHVVRLCRAESCQARAPPRSSGRRSIGWAWRWVRPAVTDG